MKKWLSVLFVAALTLPVSSALAGDGESELKTIQLMDGFVEMVAANPPIRTRTEITEKFTVGGNSFEFDVSGHLGYITTHEPFSYQYGGACTALGNGDMVEQSQSEIFAKQIGNEYVFASIMGSGDDLSYGKNASVVMAANDRIDKGANDS